MATAQANADNAAAPLDQLLIDVGAGPLRRWLPGRPGVEFIASLAGRPRIASLAATPRKVGRRLSIMVGELDRVALGRSAVEPKRGDRRFADMSSSPRVPRMVDPDAPKPGRDLALTPGAVEATDALVKTAGEAASDVPVTGVLDEAAAQRIRSLNQQVLDQASAAGAVDGYEKASTGTRKPCRIWPTSKPRSRAAARLTGRRLSPARRPSS